MPTAVEPEALYDQQYRGTMRATSRNLDTDGLLKLALERAPDPTVLDEIDPFFFRTVASNDRLDSYFTRMADTSLKNYAADATAGVQFQNSHNGSGLMGLGAQIGFGRSLRGQVVTQGKERQLWVDFMTQRGLACGNLTSDQFIQGLRAGIYQDVSIGFMPGRFECSICGGDMLNWRSENRCEHIPGVTYEVKKGGRTSKQLAYAWVHDAHLNEVSTVYDGATPGAGVLAVEKARAMMATGHLSWGTQQLVEGIYRCPIIGPGLTWRGVGDGAMDGTIIDLGEEHGADTAAATAIAEPRDAGAGGDTAVTSIAPLEGERAATATATPDSDPLLALRAKYEGTPITLGSDPVQALEVVADAYLALRTQHATLSAEAADGRAYRKHLMERLEQEAVRALGAERWELAKPRWMRTAGAASTEDLRGYIEDFERDGNKRLGAGDGRVTRSPEPKLDGDGDTDDKGRRPTHDRNLP